MGAGSSRHDADSGDESDFNLIEPDDDEPRAGGACTSSVLDAAPVPDDEGYWVDYKGPGPWYACLPNSEVPPRFAGLGSASSEHCPPETLPQLMSKAAMGAKGEEDFMKVEDPLPPLDKDGKAPPALEADDWKTWSFEDAFNESKQAAKGFITLGLQQFDSVNIWGFNSPEWLMSSYAANMAGAKVAGIYPTDTPETAAYKVVHSGGGIVVVEDRPKLEKLVKALSARGDAKRLKGFVVYGFDPQPNETVMVAGSGPKPVVSWQTLLNLGEALPQGDEHVNARIASTRPGHCAALIYTSGTTGEPKAVMISHDNIIFEATCVLRILRQYHGVCGKGEAERVLSYLPLSHVAGMMVDMVCPLVAAARSKSWITVFFARQYDLKAGSIKDRLNVAKPTVFLGVPLVWEKIADRIRAIGAETTGVKKTVADWAKGLGLTYAKNCQLGASGSTPFGYSLCSSLVLSKIKANLGLDECKYGFTGAAPIRVDTLEYFGSLGLHINEVYGMSECTGACTISTDAAHEWGSCGWELPGVEVKAFIVDPNDFNKKQEVERSPDLNNTEEIYQGELCFRGRNIMMGYMAQPDLGQAHVAEMHKKTAEAIDNEGWLHSGDKGMITEAGMVKITGRYKELIIGDGGENIAPVPIEDQVKKACDGIAEVMMVGDKRKYNVALITLKAKGANGEVPGTDDLDAGAARLNPNVKTISAAMDDKTIIDAVTKAVEAANKNTKVCHNNAFKIQKFTILPTNFSEEKNQLTPTKKLKRKNVETQYADLIEKMYRENGTYIRF
eukprot:TRINITY_DN17359_c0_g1_i1.p1 TRINITY_DN17359_c0_g1~~TRINITY_DN17359_c0_g1_i1.p1  ORF type:complete len:784 (-),score=160.71 TRINITY_DN17359_c0_g1_i1:269-2620(-)